MEKRDYNLKKYVTIQELLNQGISPIDLFDIRKYNFDASAVFDAILLNSYRGVG